MLLATTGMRRSEALGLQWADVDLAADAVSIRRAVIVVDGRTEGGPPKSAASRRLVMLHATTTTVLAEHQDRSDVDASPWVFAGLNGQPVNPASFSATFERLVTRSGLPRIRVHDLRHSYATIALRVGVHPAIVSERLGHSSIAITIDLYSHVMPSMQRDGADAVARLVLPDSPGAGHDVGADQ